MQFAGPVDKHLTSTFSRILGPLPGDSHNMWGPMATWLELPPARILI